MAEEAKLKVTIVGAGNASQALAALFPFKGFETYMYCPYQDEAERFNAGIAEQGYMLADFGSHNEPTGEVKGTPVKCSKDPAEVIPQADVIIMCLPSFTYLQTLTDIKPHLRPGQKIGVSPGQGAFDWIARDVLGEDLMSQLTLYAILPMPFNCRVEAFGKKVNVQMFKRRYRVGVQPVSKLDEVIRLNERMFGHTEPCGSFLTCSLYPINAVIHPARLFTLLEHWTSTGEALTENPLFYEQMTDEAGVVMDKVNQELIQFSEALQAKGLAVQIPHIFDFLAKYVYEDESETLVDFFRNSAAYKGFRCPLKSEDDGKTFVPDFGNRYFTEDIPMGLCLYKGVADLLDVPTPTIDMIISWAQRFMGKEYIKNGRLAGSDVKDTIAPQSFGIDSLDSLMRIYA
eukprot:TRINITY_DN22281_c0_g1_i1.p1 TRINITY_DN22281_c0_g1~~TRINITY_DN22281_c0_g1_i1.p1  ORF type:complete len:419 (+),score=64.97 TRINITY_DN22281_c0_g1_i1:56-1258(+)